MKTDTETCRKISLAEMFPQFRFASAAETFLKNCSSFRVEDQLKTRRITRVTIAPIIGPGSIRFGEDQHFEVVLNDHNLLAENVGVIGHEMGHTFHYNLTKKPPQDLTKPADEKTIEEFCQEFSRRWVENNGVQKIMEWFQCEQTTILHNFPR